MKINRLFKANLISTTDLST